MVVGEDGRCKSRMEPVKSAITPRVAKRGQEACVNFGGGSKAEKQNYVILFKIWRKKEAVGKWTPFGSGSGQKRLYIESENDDTADVFVWRSASK